MKILHTSDWHLGRALYGRRRYEEFSDFLDWLFQTIVDEEIDALLVAGDIFDTSTPGNFAQELYYRFLCRVAASKCRHIVVIGGNHDSPSFLNAPKELLQALDIYVVGAMTQNPEDEVIVLYDDKKPAAVICAVPYLRDRDIRIAEAGETIDDKNAKLISGLKSHYAEVCSIAEQKRCEFIDAGLKDIPIIAMGHLFAAGGKTIDGDGIRELYVGSLVHVGSDIFPPFIDYVALGHLHVPQIVGGAQNIRYSGSPLPLSFGEASQTKMVIIVDFKDSKLTIKEKHVPCFMQLVQIKGTLDKILSEIKELKDQNIEALIEIIFTDDGIAANIHETIFEAAKETSLEILRIKTKQSAEQIMKIINDNETLKDLTPVDVFNRCLDAGEVPAEERNELTATYNEILQSLQDEDINAK
ncbi:MAG: exonuclease SbcCD subunit D C-terminal domain-containing protein [Deltaproteobacteria bacterium]|nr:exonuclease SbcCD subunit D C-terminal domain-containing protein [Deltaproteobacteria bacterium]